MICNDCRQEVLDYDCVSLITEVGSVSLCSNCFNKRFERDYDIDTTKVGKTSLLLKDKEGHEHFFRIKKILVPTGYLLKAQEFIDNEPKGYLFDVHGEIDCDQNKLEEELLRKVKEGLAYQSIEISEMFGESLKEKVFGRIDCDLEWDSDGPIMIIDGKEYTWEAFGRMLKTYEGWKFKLELD